MADTTNIVPIANLNPYSGWTIKARVTNKSGVRTWSNDKGTGKLFSVDLVDASGEIKCTCFNDCVDLFEPIFQVNQVYLISKGSIKAGNPRFTKAEFEMSLSKNSIVKPVQDQTSSVPKVRYNFVDIDALVGVSADTLVDVCGVITEIGNPVPVKTKKDGRTTTKRSVTIVDATKHKVDVTFWAEKAETFDHSEGTVIALKNARVGDYQGSKNLSITTTTQVDFEPSHPGALELASWYGENREQLLAPGGAPSITGDAVDKKDVTMGSLQSLAEDAARLAGDASKSAVYKVVCTLLWIKHDENSMVYYKAVPTEGRQKVVEANGRYLCQSTGQYYDTYIPRFMITVIGADNTSSQFFTVFDDFGSSILGVDAKQVEQLREGPHANEKQFNDVFEEVLGKRFLFKLKAKEEVYGDSQKLRIVVGGVEKVDYVQQSKNLIESIVALHNQ